MLQLLSDKDILEMEKKTNGCCLFREDLEHDLVYNSKEATITLPQVFLGPLFEVVYNRVLSETKFKDGNENNWMISNIKPA
jgi:hypothetical protein